MSIAQQLRETEDWHQDTVDAILDLLWSAEAMERILCQEWSYGVETTQGAEWWDDWEERRIAELDSFQKRVEHLRSACQPTR